MQLNKKGLKIIGVLLLLCSFLCGCTATDIPSESTGNVTDTSVSSIIPETSVIPEDVSNEVQSGSETVVLPIEDTEPNGSEELKDVVIKFIDVGQADSCLIVTPNDDIILIDAGEEKDASAILNVLKGYSFEDIDLMVLTHPHADHIGGAAAIMETYNVEEVLMPNCVSTSKTFENVLDVIETEEVTLNTAYIGQMYNIDDVKIQVLGTDSVPDDANNSSIILKVTYGTVDMLMMGDAEVDADEVVLQSNFDLRSEVLKLGHHGSDTSTSQELLDAVSPTMGIISVGEDNSYGHPSDSILKRLFDNGIQYYRTDEMGTITLEVDGTNIVYSFDDNSNVQNKRSGLSTSDYIVTPNIASVQLEDEKVVLESIENNS